MYVCISWDGGRGRDVTLKKCKVDERSGDDAGMAIKQCIEK